MSTFVPFKAIRPLPKFVKSVASRPYDVLNAKEALEEAEDNPLSFYHVIKPEIDFPIDADPYAPEIYQKGKENFDRLVERGIMVEDAEPSFYVYRLNMGDHEQTGLVGCCSIDEYFNNIIKKHELTREDKETDRINHIRTSKLNYEAVFFFYPAVSNLDKLVEEATQGGPEFDFVSEDNIRHRVWTINQPDIVSDISSCFKSNVPSLYIADGHHRTAAGALTGRELREERHGQEGDGGRDNYFMAVAFPDSQLKILDYNRLVKDLHGLSEQELLEKIANDFTIEKRYDAYHPERLHTYGMYLHGTWYKLTAKAGSFKTDDPIEELDVTILSKKILEPYLGIHDLRKDKRIEFVGGMRGLSELEKRVDSGEMKVAFAMFPVSIQQVINISDHDLIMPPKVTWFEPKLRSGLFVHKLC
ncbi:MAG: DUF1015 domain-containing protein [Saprospiraceae bacterium]|nr:DUF1015 domain-containing protein [Saprospiraceae bacterium]